MLEHSSDVLDDKELCHQLPQWAKGESKGDRISKNRPFRARQELMLVRPRRKRGSHRRIGKPIFGYIVNSGNPSNGERASSNHEFMEGSLFDCGCCSDDGHRCPRRSQFLERGNIAVKLPKLLNARANLRFKHECMH